MDRLEEFEEYIKTKQISPPTTDGAQQTSYADRVLCAALDIGEGLLRCGGEINRVENTIERICRAYGAKHVEVFTITSAIFTEVRMSDGSYSCQIRRVLGTDMSTDLYLLERLNAVSRKICNDKTDVDEAIALIKATKKIKTLPSFVPILGAFLAAGAFAVFFGGNILDGIIAAFVGAIMTVIENHRPSFINKMASTVICSFIGGLLAHLLSSAALYVGLSGNVDKVMIGTIMLLIPGASFGYALRDLMFGDTLSGTLKIVQAVLLAAMIAFGFSASILLVGGLGI